MMNQPQEKKPWRARALIALAVLLGLVVALVVGVRVFSAGILQGAIERSLRTKTALATASIGLYGESSAEGLILFDEQQDQPMLRVGRTTADLSMLGFLAGNALPDHACLEGVQLDLRFDKDGGLITKLPSPTTSGDFPLLEVRDATIRLLQEGREPFALENVNLSTKRGEGGDDITGTAEDPTWGRFTITGKLKPEPLELSLVLHQDKASITPEQLKTVPFIPAAVWDRVQPHGTSPLTISLRFTDTAPYVRYGVEFSGLPMALAQEGRPPFKALAASGKLDGDVEKGFTLTGQAEAPHWGRVGAEVGLAQAASELSVRLKVPPTDVTTAKLREIPYVPPGTWDKVNLNGKASADVLVRISTRDGAVHYRALASPTKMRVDIPSVGLTVLDAAGQVAVEDNLVVLKEIKDATVELKKEGRKPLVLKNVKLTARGGAGDEFTGSVDSADLGQFAITGKLKPQPPELALQLHQAKARITPERLKAVPFVSPAVWDRVQPDGTAPLTISLKVTNAAPFVRYGVEFSGLPMALAQEGRPPFAVQSTSGKLEGDPESGFTLTGQIDDPQWGKWAASVKLALEDGPDKDQVRVELKGPPIPVQPEKLRKLPYVPQNVWDEAVLTGTARADVSVRISTLDGAVHYRVDAAPTGTTVEIPRIGLKATRVAGKVLVEDNLVTLRDVTGHAADGTLTLKSSELDFRTAVTKMVFDLKVNALVLASLPTKWGINLKGTVDGDLTGEANLKLTIRDGKIHTEGSGQGKILNAKVLGFDAKDPIPLKLESHKSGFKFSSPSLSAPPKTGAKAPVPLFALPGLLAVGAPPRPEPVTPGGLAGKAANSVTALAEFATGTARAVLDGVSAVERVTRPGQPDTYIDTTFTLTDVDLRLLGQRAGAPLPEGFGGRVTVNVQAGIPVNNARDATAYRVRGTVSSKRLELARVPLEDVQARINFNKGLATIEGLTAKVGGGRVTGSARAVVSPPGDVVLALELADIKVDQLRAALPDAFRADATGTLSGKASASVPWKQANDLAAWRGSGNLRAKDLGALTVTADTASADFSLLRGTLQLTSLKADLLGASVTGKAGLNLTAPYQYEAGLTAPGLDLAKLPARARVAGLEGKATLSADLKGKLGGEAAGKGQIKAAGLKFKGFEAGPLQADWVVRNGRVVVTDFTGQVEGGKATGKGELGFDGNGKADLQLVGLESSNITKRIEGLAFQLTGKFNADVKATFKPGNKVEAAADLSGDRLSLAGPFPVEVRGMKGTVNYRDGKLDYAVTGTTFAGKFNARGKYPAPPPKPDVGGKGDRSEGHFRLDRARVSEILRAVTGRRVPVSGFLSLDLPFRHGPGGAVEGDGRVVVSSLRHGGTELSESLRGSVQLRASGITLRTLTGTIAGGSLRLRGGYRFRVRPPGWFALSLSRVEASQLLLLAGDADGRVKGPVDVELRGTVGRDVRAAGTVTLTRGTVFGVEAADWNAPVDVTYVPATGRGEFRLRESSAQVGTGRARARFDAHWGGGSARVEGTVRFSAASIKSLAGLIGDVSTYARGNVTGRVDIGGSEVRSPNDLTAEVNASLRDTQATQLPVFRQLSPFLGLGGSATVFNKGQLRGRLAGGVFRVRELSLDSPAANVFMTGTVTTAGRLDLDVTARTNSLGNVNPVLLTAILRRVPAVGPIPVGLITRLTELLSNRVVHLRVTGTTASPVVRVLPLRILTDEAARYFLLRLAAP